MDSYIINKIKFLINIVLVIYIKTINILINKLNILKPKLSFIKILNKNFSKNSEFNFIQIGAHDGRRFDLLYDFVIERKSEGIVVEPINQYFRILVENYKNFGNILGINCAIHPNLTEVNLFKVKEDSLGKYPEWVIGIVSLNDYHLLKNNIYPTDIEMIKVKATHFNNLLIYKDPIFFNNVDLLQIDVEGFDYEIIKIIDFSKLNIKIIKYEHVNLNHTDRRLCRELLKAKGFYIFQEGNDTIGINLKKIKL